MLEKAETEILYNALYIIINFKKFKEYTKKNKPSLYKKIYKLSNNENVQLITKEEIQKIIDENGIKIIKEIEETQNKLAETEKTGIIGKFSDYIRLMIINYNAIHDNEPDVQEFDLWRPKIKNIKG